MRSLGYCFSFFFFFCSFQVKASHPYAEQYASECKEALEFYHSHSKKFDKAASGLNVNGTFLFAIVSPEVSQYGYLSDVAETSLMKVLYVQGGKNYADFSVGVFQMKPSFIERMEDSIRKNPALKSKFSDYLFKNPQSREARVERLDRLEKLEWQLKYLALFCSVMEQRFAGRQFSTIDDKLLFYASAYNTGFHKTASDIEKIGQKAFFPHFANTKYRYNEIALWFYKNAG